MKACITSIGSYVPKNRVSNDDLSHMVDTSDEWIYSHTGIRYRHIIDDKMNNSDMAYYAAAQTLETAKLSPKALDMILVATSTPDFAGYPSTACLVQDKLKAENAGAMDISAACTGFIYGFSTAAGYIRSGMAKHVLLIGSEANSRIINWKDRNTCVLFGDGAGSVLLSAQEESQGEILTSLLRSEGSGAGFMDVSPNGERFPFGSSTPLPNQPYIKMDGRQVYSFAVRSICTILKYFRDDQGVPLNDLKYIVPHQANARIITAAAKRMDIPMEKFYMNVEEYANTSAATIPIALHELEKNGKVEPGDLLLTLGFGAGLTYGGTLIRW